MAIIDPMAALRQLTQTASQSIPPVSGEAIANFLNTNGWTVEVAGQSDFDLVVRALTKAHTAGRGIFVTGVPGCGKTQLLKTLAKNYSNSLFLYCKDRSHLKFMRDVADGDTTIDGYRNIFIDDMGCEELLMEYGNKIDIVGDFIQRLYDKFNGRVFISSNNGPTWVQERYGGRVLDRILDMCVAFNLNGTSKRERMVVK